MTYRYISSFLAMVSDIIYVSLLSEYLYKSVKSRADLPLIRLF